MSEGEEDDVYIEGCAIVGEIYCMYNVRLGWSVMLRVRVCRRSTSSLFHVLSFLAMSLLYVNVVWYELDVTE